MEIIVELFVVLPHCVDIFVSSKLAYTSIKPEIVRPKTLVQFHNTAPERFSGAVSTTGL